MQTKQQFFLIILITVLVSATFFINILVDVDASKSKGERIADKAEEQGEEITEDAEDTLKDISKGLENLGK